MVNLWLACFCPRSKILDCIHRSLLDQLDILLAIETLSITTFTCSPWLSEILSAALLNPCFTGFKTLASSFPTTPLVGIIRRLILLRNKHTSFLDEGIWPNVLPLKLAASLVEGFQPKCTLQYTASFVEEFWPFLLLKDFGPNVLYSTPLLLLRDFDRFSCWGISTDNKLFQLTQINTE